jgi:hypothetical protein
LSANKQRWLCTTAKDSVGEGKSPLNIRFVPQNTKAFNQRQFLKQQNDYLLNMAHVYKYVVQQRLKPCERDLREEGNTKVSDVLLMGTNDFFIGSTELHTNTV